jgi:RHS repeat-associated protein
VIEERLGTSPDSADAERQFVWGLRYIDDLILRDRDTSTPHDGVDQRHYALQDANWNVVAIVEPDGDVAERYSYTAYGKAEFREPTTFAQKNPNASSFGWTVLYTGRDLDVETGLQINRNRYYHLDLGRFIVVDFELYDAGDVNLYRYCRNSPVLYVDPAGLVPMDAPFGWSQGERDLRDEWHCRRRGMP